MRVVSRPPLIAFAKRYRDAEPSLVAWWSLMRKKTYRTPHELKADFPSADFVGDGITIFNIGGRKYRLIVHMRYDIGIAFVKGILTHAEYDDVEL